MATIIVEIRGGCLCEVYSDADDLRVIKVDWDDAEDDPMGARGIEFDTASLTDMPPETARAVELCEFEPIEEEGAC